MKKILLQGPCCIDLLFLSFRELTAFIGYVLPWGEKFAPNDSFNSSLSVPLFDLTLCLACYFPLGGPKIPTLTRIGPHNIDVISVLVGN